MVSASDQPVSTQANEKSFIDPSPEVVTIGEALLRLSAPLGSLIADAPTLSVHVAGTELNVAAAVARMGYHSAWLSLLPANSLGRRVTEHARLCGVDDRFVQWSAEGRLGTYFFEPGTSPRSARVIYDRANSTATTMEFDQFDWPRLTRARFLHVTGITVGISQRGAELVRRAIEWARSHGIRVVFDVNYRALLWNPRLCRSQIEPLLAGIDVLLTSARDAGIIFGLEGPPEKVLESLQQVCGCKMAALTTGADGAVGWSGQEYLFVPGYSVEMINRLGAGDSFAAGVLCGLLEGDFHRGIHYGVAMSALTLTSASDAFAFTRQDVRDLLEFGPGATIVR